MTINRRFDLYVVAIFAVFTVALSIAGFFSIGLLSDDYLNINGSIHSTFADKLTGNLPFTNSYHLRTTYYLSMQSSSYLHDKLGFAYDDFILYRIQNLLLYFVLAYLAGRIVLLISNHLSVSVLTSLVIMIFPNNINNICWTAARADMLCGIFYLFALYFAFRFVKEGDQTAFVNCILSLIAGLLTKETAITVPVISGILIFAFFGKKILLEKKSLIITQLSLVAIYLFYKLVILGNNPVEMITLYQSSPLANAPGIIARAAIALTIPLDFLTLNIALRAKEPLLMIYMASLYGAVFYIALVMIRNVLYIYLGYAALCAGILIMPNIYIGYIRTQMILVPFVIMAILLFWAYDHQLKNSIHINKTLLKGFFMIALAFWTITCFQNVSDWSFAYSKSKDEVKELIRTGIDPGGRTIIVGNPGRFRQALLFDKLTGAYNYWKNHDFVIKDTINDIVQTGALDPGSLNAALDVKRIQPNQFEIRTTGASQYFYMEGFDNEKIRDGFRNKDMSVEFSEFNLINKPVKLKLTVTNPSVRCYVAGNLKFTKIF